MPFTVFDPESAANVIAVHASFARYDTQVMVCSRGSEKESALSGAKLACCMTA
jgi:hypothetical protein